MRISVIIPTLDEAGQIAELIGHTRTLGECQIVVVDGQSADGTLECAADADIVLSTPRGRAVQMNAGAEAADGDALLFLHADCRLAPGAFEAVERTLARPGVIVGCFRQSIDARGLGHRLIERGNAARVSLFGLAYGDQGLFLRREAFQRLGRFPEIPFLEDLEFTKSAKAAGRIALADSVLRVSARRWRRRGLLRQTLANWTMIALAHAGVSPTYLARFYKAVR